MSKKERVKKKCWPRTLAIPSYHFSLDQDFAVADPIARSKDRTFVLRIANRTASREDLAIQDKIF